MLQGLQNSQIFLIQILLWVIIGDLWNRHWRCILATSVMSVKVQSFLYDNASCVDTGLPGMSAICTVDEGETVQLLDSSPDGWSRVRCGDLEGFMKFRNLKRAKR